MGDSAAQGGSQPPGPQVAGRVSLVIPAYNRAALIGQTLTSVIQADYRALEVIIADDGSTDGTADVVTRFAREHPDLLLHLLRLPHAGAVAARNRGVAAASGEFVLFLDSDDLLAGLGLTAMVAELADPTIPYCVGRLIEQDLSGNQQFAEGHGDPVLDHESVVRSQWPTIVALYRRNVFDRLGVFDESLSYGEDKEFLWRIVAGCPPGKVVHHVVAIRRNHSLGQLTDSYDVRAMGRHTIGALDAFATWAERTGHMRPAIARAAYPRLWLALIRVGSQGDKAWVAEALSLAERLARQYPAPVHKLLSRIFAHLPATGFALLHRLLLIARASVHTLRNLQRRLTS